MASHLIHRDPFDMTSPVWGLGRLWDDFFPTGRAGNGTRSLQPAMDIAETEQGYTLTVELPGLQKKDVKITVEDGVLTLSGEKRRETEQDEKNYHRVERVYGAFSRSVSLPVGVDAGKADARFENGVLTIDLPKTEAAKPQTVNIK
jgi:HSP20 family protein